MARKSRDIALPEVRNPDYGVLVAVLRINKTRRELWFQHGSVGLAFAPSRIQPL